jgi:hypothetical protein
MGWHRPLAEGTLASFVSSYTPPAVHGVRHNVNSTVLTGLLPPSVLQALVAHATYGPLSLDVFGRS